MQTTQYAMNETCQLQQNDVMVLKRQSKELLNSVDKADFMAEKKQVSGMIPKPEQMTLGVASCIWGVIIGFRNAVTVAMISRLYFA